MPVTYRNGTEGHDARLGRLIQFDERSRNYPISAILHDRKRSYTWRCDTHLDQGTEGSCVGHAFAHDIAARPSVSPVTSSLALQIYRRAQQIDEWPGEGYSGTSILAGAKATKEAGYLDEYRWAFGLDDLISAVGYHGPAVLGVNWYQGMIAPGADGFIHPTGQFMGGHAILCHSVSIKHERFTLHNSWGPTWGRGGRCYVSFTDMNRLLSERGEACIPVKRVRPKVS